MPKAFELPIIVITVRPIERGRFEARHAGRALAASSTEPFCAAARQLLAEGFPPDAVLGMRYLSETDFALRGRLGAAARLTVADASNGAPRFRRWKAPPSGMLAPPMRPQRRGLPDIGPTAFERVYARGRR